MCKSQLLACEIIKYTLTNKTFNNVHIIEVCYVFYKQLRFNISGKQERVSETILGTEEITVGADDRGMKKVPLA